MKVIPDLEQQSQKEQEFKVVPSLQLHNELEGSLEHMKSCLKKLPG